MQLCRIVVRGFRNFAKLDVPVNDKVTCIVGENNTGKSNLIFALRLAIDASMSSTFRNLDAEDFCSGTDISQPTQILISLEFKEFKKKDNEEGLFMHCILKDDRARITYRFRPKRKFIEEFKAGKLQPLKISDYHYEMRGGGGSTDPATVAWDADIGKSIDFDALQQAYLVVLMEALRDVEQRLRQLRYSPLAKLLTSEDITPEEQATLVACLKTANKEISESKTISSVGADIKQSMDDTAGKAFTMGVSLGMSAPTFTDISRNLTVLLSNKAINGFEPGRNGLGLNNILYISMYMVFFARRVKEAKTAGQLLIVEEPEAHLHPQLQRILYSSLRTDDAQAIITTHSTHITSQAPLASMIVLTDDGTVATHSSVAVNKTFTDKQIADLERYLDATRSTLLFARKVILVEGPAELFLLPPLIEHVLKIDLDSEGISVIPIHGAHFEVYAKLFGPALIAKKCAIITDGDAQNEIEEEPVEEDDEELIEEEDDDPKPTRLEALKSYENDHLKVLVGETTFEMELTLPGTLEMFITTLEELGSPRTTAFLKKLQTGITDQKLTPEQITEKLKDAKKRVLNASKRFSKGRFAQVASKYAKLATELPAYIKDAVKWVTE